MAKLEIIRRLLLNVELGSKQVRRVEVREIIFKPGQETGRHKHPCPVICYIAEGVAIVQEEGKLPREVRSGESVFEPANTIMGRFDNASSTQPMKFIAHYLLEGDEELIQMLE